LIKEVVKGSITGGKLSLVTFAKRFLKLIEKNGETSKTDEVGGSNRETENESEDSED
jgi:hypothetical protein